MLVALMLVAVPAVGLAIGGRSQPPTPSDLVIQAPPQKPPAAEADKPESHQQDGNGPSAVKPKEPTLQKKAEAADTPDKGGKESADWWLVRLTFGLLIVGAIQAVVFWVQASRLKQTVDAMREIDERQSTSAAKAIAIAETNAAAAKRSADGLISLERPWLVASAEPVGLTKVFKDALTSDGLTGVEINVRFRNEGRTTAFLGRYRAFAAMAAYPKPDTGVQFTVDNGNQSIGPGEEITFPMGVGLMISRDDAAGILEGDVVVWFFGSLEYTDFFRGRRATHFCFDHNSVLGCVAVWGDETENYMT